MTTSQMYDAAWPPGHPPAWPVVAGYLGGDTPHVWSVAEWDHQPARYRLPIWVRSNPGAVSAATDTAAAVSAAHKLGVPRGATIALDFETAVMPSYVAAFDKVMTAAGYGTILYGSASTVRKNPQPSRGFWIAEWTGSPHLVPGSAATQYAGSRSTGGAYDSSVIATSVPLWDTHPPAPVASGGTAHADKPPLNSTPSGILAREVWNTDNVISVPQEWNGTADNPYWAPSSILVYAVNLLREVRDELKKG